MNVRDWFATVWNQDLGPAVSAWWNAPGSTQAQVLTDAFQEVVEVGQDLLRTVYQHPISTSMFVLGCGLVLAAGCVPPVEWIVGTIVVWCVLGWLEAQVNKWLAIQALRDLLAAPQKLGAPQPQALPAYLLV